MQRDLALIDAAFGERFCFHCMQTDVLLARADAAARARSELDYNSGTNPPWALLLGNTVSMPRCSVSRSLR